MRMWNSTERPRIRLASKYNTLICRSHQLNHLHLYPAKPVRPRGRHPYCLQLHHYRHRYLRCHRAHRSQYLPRADSEGRRHRSHKPILIHLTIRLRRCLRPLHHRFHPHLRRLELSLDHLPLNRIDSPLHSSNHLRRRLPLFRGKRVASRSQFPWNRWNRHLAHLQSMFPRRVRHNGACLPCRGSACCHNQLDLYQREWKCIRLER